MLCSVSFGFDNKIFQGYEFHDKEACDSCPESEDATLYAESARPRTVEESLRQWRAELDALDAVHKVNMEC